MSSIRQNWDDWEPQKPENQKNGKNVCPTLTNCQNRQKVYEESEECPEMELTKLTKWAFGSIDSLSVISTRILDNSSSEPDSESNESTSELEIPPGPAAESLPDVNSRYESFHPAFRKAREERLNDSDPVIRGIWQKISTWPVINQAGFGIRVGLLVKDGMPEAQATDQVYTLMEPIMARKVISLKGR